MMRVLHIVEEKTPPDLLEQLALLTGADDTVLSVGRPPRPGPPVAIRPVHRPMGSARLAGIRMRPAAESADILHAWSPGAMRAGIELSLAAGKALVASLACVGTAGEVRAVREAVGPGLLTLTVPTRRAREALIRRGLPERFVHVLPPAAGETADRAATRTRVRKSLGIGEAVPLVVAPDTMAAGAGHDIACWAHAIVCKVLGGLCLLLPGGGRKERHVRFFSGTTGHGDAVFFTGDRFSRVEALAASDVAAFFREREVGLSAVAAAAAAGLGIAASRTGDIAELVPDGEAALLVEPGDPRAAAGALLKLIEQPDLAERLGAAARRRAAESLKPAVCRRRLEEIYAAAIEAKAF